MGALHASEFAQSVSNGKESLETALIYHFQSNHYPPLPLSLIPIAIRIIRGEVKGNLVKLPHGIAWKGRPYAPVIECIQAWHLSEFLGE